MLILRVEHKVLKQGPYVAFFEEAEENSRLSFLLSNYYNYRTQPCPEQDGIDPPPGWRYGFESRRQLLDWFGSNLLEQLAQLGFQVVSYEVPLKSILRGRRQVAYMPEAAVLVSEEVSY